MPEISTEIFIDLVLVFILILFFNGKKVDKTNKVYAFFIRLIVFSLISVTLEGVSSYCTSHSDMFNIPTIIFALECFWLSTVCTAYVCFLYIKHLLNMELPSLRKIGDWTNYAVGGLLVAAQIVPILGIDVSEDAVVFNGAIYVTVLLIFVFELFMGVLFVINWRYINPKRRKIAIILFIVEAAIIWLQICFIYHYLTSVSLVIMVISFYMSLEDSDVQLIDQLALEKEKANAANMAKSVFIANVSHEIRTPINAVLGMDEMILRESKESMTRQYALDIKSAANTLHGIINEILDMSKMESGIMEIVPARYDLRHILNDIVNIFQLKMDDKHLSFIVNVNPDMPSGYFGDSARLKQILTNILSNAVKYTKEGSVTMTVDIRAKYDNKADLFFSIKDTGIGMKEEDLEDLFKEYVRLDYGLNRNVEGTGLGMTITKRLLKLMGSKLEVKSKYNEGSDFYFTLTQDIVNEDRIGEYKIDNGEVSDEYVYQESFKAPSISVLVVDDNEINRKVFVGLLKNTDLSIDEASSGPECIMKVRKKKYDIIFLDHMMPDMDGMECFKILKSMGDNKSIRAKIIMLTANAVSGAKEEYLESGFDDFIAKPIIPSELENMIKKYI